MDRWGRRKRALRICSSLHVLNIFCILLIRCTSVLLFFEEVWRDAPRYWAHESGESSTELLVSRVLSGVGDVGGENGIVNSGRCGRGHGLSRGRDGEDVGFPKRPYMCFGCG